MNPIKMHLFSTDKFRINGGLVQDYSISIVNALDILQSCTKLFSNYLQEIHNPSIITHSGAIMISFNMIWYYMNHCSNWGRIS